MTNLEKLVAEREAKERAVTQQELEAELHRWHYAYKVTYANLYQDLRCGVCGDHMAVKRNCPPLGGMGGSISGKNKVHDIWECVKIKESWHRQAQGLQEEIDETHSARLAAIMSEELEGILDNREATKIV